MRYAQRTTGGLGAGIPPMVWGLVAVVFVLWALQFFAVTAPLVALLRLTPLAWRSFFLWEIVTYPFAGSGAANAWILVELFILALFATSVVERLGRRGFWRLILFGAVAGAAATLVVDAVASIWGGGALSYPLIQGQRALLALMIAAFATLNPRATIMLFFVIPMPARWFLPLELLLAFIGFLSTKDLPGFVGLVVAIGTAWVLCRGGGLGKALRELRLRTEAAWLRRRLSSRRRGSGFRVVQGGRDEKPN